VGGEGGDEAPVSKMKDYIAERKRLNLGCWTERIAGAWNVDIEPWCGVDELVDLNTLPWPWEDGRWDDVRAVDILEHLGKLTKTEIVSELARVSRIGATLTVRVPAASHAIALQSIQHAHVFYLDSFATDYAQPHFRCQRREVSFFANRITLPFVHPWRPILRLAGRFGLIYCITFHLVRIKTEQIEKMPWLEYSREHRLRDI